MILKIIKLEKKILERNDKIAEENRKIFSDFNLFVMNWISSPGSGKTSLLEKIAEELNIKQIKLNNGENKYKYFYNTTYPLREVFSCGKCGYGDLKEEIKSLIKGKTLNLTGNTKWFYVKTSAGSKV